MRYTSRPENIAGQYKKTVYLNTPVLYWKNTFYVVAKQNMNVKKLLIDEQLQISVDGFKSYLKAMDKI